jgi:hypothetical protein
MGLGGQRHAPLALPPRKTRYPLYMNKDPLKRPPGDYRRCSECAPWVPMQAWKHTDFWAPFHHVWLGLFTTIFSETSFLTYCKMWIFWPKFINGSCMMVLHQIFFLQFRNSWTTAWTACYPDLSFLDTYFWGHLKVTVNDTAVRTCNHEYRMDL